MLFAARSAAALHRLLDTLPVFAGDGRIVRRFTLVPGSEFDADALAALDSAGARTIPWAEALATSYDLILAASPKGDLHRLGGPIALLPHGAGFNKTIAGEGDRDSASGLDPAYLLRNGTPLAALHALAHPSQLDRLAAHCPPAAAHAAVVGDPTLERLLDSRALRERYRSALGTEDRRLIVLTSTWGPWSLLARRPELPAALAAALPVDSYQLAVVAHPNTHSEPGTLNLLERLPAGVHLARPFEEWASVLVAADAVVTDHGSAALYAAALGRPVLSACDGGTELLPGTPMARLLASAPHLADPARLPRLLAGYPSGVLRAAADGAFAARGQALARLRTALYRILGLAPHVPPPEPRLLPMPRRRAAVPTVHAVRVLVTRPGGDGHAPVADVPVARVSVEVERRLPDTDVPLHHVAVEEDAALTRHVHSAGLLYRRVRAEAPAPGTGAFGGAASWTAAGWTAHALATYPGCRTAAVIVSDERCVIRRRGRAGLLSVRTSPLLDEGRIVLPDPAAVLSAVHGVLGHAQDGAEEDEEAVEAVGVRTVAVDCRVGRRTYRVLVGPAGAAEGTEPLTNGAVARGVVCGRRGPGAARPRET